MAANYKLIQSLSRAFTIIDCFSVDEKELTLNEISEKVNLNINTTRGLVQTLLHYNYLSYEEHDRTYRLGAIFLEKVEIAQYDYTEKIIRIIRDDLQQIADKYSVSSRFHAVKNLNITNIVECRPSRSRYMLAIHSQTDFPLHASASGKLILAHLNEEHQNHVLNKISWEKYGNSTITNRADLESQLVDVKANGVSVEKDELGDGYSSIAIPVFKGGNLVYTLSVVSTTQLIQDSHNDLLNELRNIREQIYELSEFK